MRVYVASKFEDLERAREVMAWLQADGHEITYDWTRCEQLSVEQAEKDRLGVMHAQAFVFVAERVEYKYCSSLTEFGIAVARRIPCVIFGHAINRDNNIFTMLPFVRTVCDGGDLRRVLKEAEPCHT